MHDVNVSKPGVERDWAALASDIKRWATALGFDAAMIGDADLGAKTEQDLQAWLAAGNHGEMDYMAAHGSKRARPAELVPGTRRVISLRMNYRPPAAKSSEAVLVNGEAAFISRYALGRDYHKVLRSRIKKLAERIITAAGDFGYRAFVDSAPVMEVAAAERAGLGWRGKHTLLLTREHGSFFFLGELFTDLPLPIDPPLAQEHCGRCTRCIDICPTQAIVAPYQVDARRCVSYLTIELKGAIPTELRPLIGNRVYGCDDCQLTCPWNRFAVDSKESDFAVRNGLDDVSLVELFAWREQDFLNKLAGTAIYRIGYERWLRNIAVGLGNAPTSPAVVNALRSRQDDASELVREHVAWALARHLDAPT
ncbi:tRNA epoxyqueuosine(34) reductase QueG [Chitinimonas sp. BJB300]|nr:tRNA epoxyqueuosine(34) reductase QueG [Chitinimonas sp. BJB300]TSJ90175.1 tRNA epoxyqueuosine(34) reductase QueG [Chitinimonas sp. BJB300]